MCRRIPRSFRRWESGSQPTTSSTRCLTSRRSSRLATAINGHEADFARIVGIVDLFGAGLLVGGVGGKCFAEQVHTREGDNRAKEAKLNPICEALRSEG